MKKAKKLGKLITDVLLAILFLLAAALYVPKMAGIQPLTVLSGSMEPAYPVGSVVYVKKVQPETIAVGDTITFHISQETLVTHRVVSKDGTSQTFETKGDANENKDGGTVAYSSVVGKVLFHIPLLGYIASYMATNSGIIITITVIVVLLLLSFLPELLRGDRREEKKKGRSV